MLSIILYELEIMIIRYLYNNINNNITITGKNSKSRYPFYDKFTLFFCAFRGPNIAGNCDGFFISSYSKKQDFLDIDMMGLNLIYFVFFFFLFRIRP
jgi:hypothetical protein